MTSPDDCVQPSESNLWEGFCLQVDVSTKGNLHVLLHLKLLFSGANLVSTSSGGWNKIQLIITPPAQANSFSTST